MCSRCLLVVMPTFCYCKCYWFSHINITFFSVAANITWTFLSLFTIPNSSNWTAHLLKYSLRFKIDDPTLYSYLSAYLCKCCGFFLILFLNKPQIEESIFSQLVTTLSGWPDLIFFLDFCLRSTWQIYCIDKYGVENGIAELLDMFMQLSC